MECDTRQRVGRSNSRRRSKVDKFSAKQLSMCFASPETDRMGIGGVMVGRFNILVHNEIIIQNRNFGNIATGRSVGRQHRYFKSS